MTGTCSKVVGEDEKVESRPGVTEVTSDSAGRHGPSVLYESFARGADVTTVYF